MLNPKLWDGLKLKPEVSKKLLEIALKFIEFLKVDVEPSDIVFTGSMASNAWTPQSDIDLHIVLDFSKIEDDVEFVREYFMAKKAVFNSVYKLKIYGYPVELYTQNTSEPNASLGIYSVLNDKWLKEPKEEKGQVDEKAVENKASHLMVEIDAAIEDQDVERLRAISEKIRVMRTAGLHENGEYSVENQTFKKLRRNGYMEKLSKAKIEMTEKMLSLSNKIKTVTAKGHYPPEEIEKIFRYLAENNYYVPPEAFVLTEEDKQNGIETVGEKLELDYPVSKDGNRYTVSLEGRDVTVFPDRADVIGLVYDTVRDMDEEVVRQSYIDMLMDVFGDYNKILEIFGYEVSTPGEFTVAEIKS